LAAGNSDTKPWFEAAEILPMSPVTAYDLRKILIDLEGIKNAWVERATPIHYPIKTGKTGAKHLKKDIAWRLREPKEGPVLDAFVALIIKNLIRLGQPEEATPEKVKKGLVDFWGEFNKANAQEQKVRLEELRTKIGEEVIESLFCHYAYANLDTTKELNEAMPLNGLYRILLELNDDLDPRSEKLQQRAFRKALRRLHADRGLCQDFAHIEVVQNWHYCLCLDLEVDPNFNEKEVAAEVLYRIQEFLVPSIRFYNFKEMRQKGLASDQVFNGPLLRNGFIHDPELKAAERLPRYIYRSDLQRIASSTPGVLDVRDLRLKSPATMGAYAEEWQLKVIDPEAPDYDATAKHPPGNLKPLLDACCTKVHILRNGLRETFTGQPLADQYMGLRMARMSLGNPSLGGPEAPTGVFREDLSDYVSVQYDLPAIYGVGANRPRPGTEYSSLQLQAYLLFFDQILAGYLAQLGQVRHLFSVEQKVTAPTMVLQSLFDVPGSRDIMGDFAEMRFQATAWEQLKTAIETEVEKLEANILNINVLIAKAKNENPEADTTDLEQRAAEQAAEIVLLNALPAETQALLAALPQGMSHWRVAFEGVMGERHFAQFSKVIETSIWDDFVRDEHNNIVQQLERIADPKARQQNRRNRLLDHMIARFGESFSEFVAVLTRADADPEDNPWRQDFGDYLQKKAAFLQQIPTLGAERGRGFDYRQKNQWEQPDVFAGTFNISGLQKRAYRLLGIESLRGGSLLGDLPYRWEIISKNNKQGNPTYLVQLFSRAADHAENPHQTGPLLSTQPIKERKLAEKIVVALYEHFARPVSFSTREIKGESDFCEVHWNFDFMGKPYEIFSKPMPSERSDEFIEKIRDLIAPQAACDREGCHLIEHILLRPDDSDDALLQLSLGCHEVETPRDPYSFWATIVLPLQAGRFEYPDFRAYTEQVFRREAPAHISLRFCWLTREQLIDFESLMEAWLEAKARCEPNNCDVTAKANALIAWMNQTDCNCGCTEEEEKSPCAPQKQPQETKK
jgi:hypothetical protein